MSRPNMLKWRDELRLPAERLFTQNCATNILKGPQASNLILLTWP